MIVVAALLLLAQEGRLPEPKSEAQREAEALVRDIFKEEYSKKTPAARIELAKKLLQQANESKDDPTSRYVLLRETRALATDAGDSETALKAVEELSTLYRIDGIALKQGTLATLALTARTPAELKPLTSALLDLADEATAQNNFEAAEKAAAAAVPAAQRAKDIPLATRAQAKSREIGELKSRYEKVRKALETLTTRPDDPAANGAVGHYLCLVKGDWEAGLPHLLKGDDPVLKGLAGNDSAAPQDATARTALADAWWDAAEKSSGRTREALRLRAAHWYGQAVEQLSGLGKVRVQKRLLESGALRPAGNWIDVTDSNLFGQPGPKGESLLIVAGDQAGGGVEMLKFPAGRYDGVSALLRVHKGEKVEAGFLIQKREKGILILPALKKVQMLRKEPTAYRNDRTADCPPRDQYVLTVLLYPGEYAVLVDGEEKFRVPTDATAIDSLELQVSYASVEFDRIALRKKE